MPEIDLGSVVGPQGPRGIQGVQGIQGIQGPPGPGVISGGSPGQILLKGSVEDYDMVWEYLTANDVSARPDTWLPKPNEIGAASNQNLLDNWYFIGGGSQLGNGKFPINQRGKTEYIHGINISGAYSIDCWLYVTASNTEQTLSVQQDGIDLGGGYLVQRSENIEKFFGKVITFSVLTADGELYSGTNTILNLTSSTMFIGSPNNYPYVAYNIFWHGFEFGCQGTIVAAKLELGSVQTLAHQDADGNWVLNDPPPNYALELAKCYRYLQPIDGMRAGVDDGMNEMIGYTPDFKTMYVTHSFPYIVPMRAAPTLINYDGNARIAPMNTSYTSNASILTNVSLAVGSSKTNTRCTVVASKTSDTAFNSASYGLFGELDFLSCTTTPLLSAEL